MRRRYIPKKDGKQRPLGMPSWSDKLLGELVRLLLEVYYKPGSPPFPRFGPAADATPPWARRHERGLVRPGLSRATSPAASTSYVVLLGSRRAAAQRTFPLEMFTIHKQAAIPISDGDVPPNTAARLPPTTPAQRRIQAIACTAAFHFGYIEYWCRRVLGFAYLPRFRHRAPRAPPLIGARNVEYRTRQHGSHEFTQQSRIWAGRSRFPR